MSLLPTSTYAGPSQAEALWAVAGSVGPGGGVTQLVAGNGILLDPPTGEGVVTVSAVGGGGGGGVTSIVAGPGIGVSSPAGDVTVSNTGVTSMVAGTGITLSGATGAVTVNAVGQSAITTSIVNAPTFYRTNGSGVSPITTNACFITNMVSQPLGDAKVFSGYIWNTAWSPTDVFLVTATGSSGNALNTNGQSASVQYFPADLGAGFPQGLRVYVVISDTQVSGSVSATVVRIPGIAA